MLSTVLLAAVVAQAPDLPPFVKEYSRVGTFYYQKPDPTLGTKMLRELLRKENLEHAFFAQRTEVLPLVASQLGDIANGHPEIVREYEAAFADATPAGRKVIIRALMNAGDKDTAKKVGEWIADKRFADQKADLEKLKTHIDDPKRKHIRDVPAKEPKDLDLLWVNFFVTGEYAPVSRILDVFDMPAGKETEVLKRVAKWSLGSNLQQHPKLVELILKNKKDRPEASKKVIDEIIVAVPTDRKK
jgi:hypothetical protein